MNLRIIPRLDIKGPNLVKGIHFEGLRVLGKPQRFARWYYEHGADELIFMDAVASLYGRNSLLDIIEATAREIFIPLTVGGGLRSTDDIYEVLKSGADKVSLNTAAVNRPELIREASRRFGSSTIVVSVEAIKLPNGTYEAYTDFGRQSTGVDAIEWAQQAEELGAGELLVTSINQEGTGQGFDLELTRRIAEMVSIPVIASGGAGNLEQVGQVITQGKADAVCLASLLHYHVAGLPEILEDDFSSEGNIRFLKSGAGFGKVSAQPLPAVKAYLHERGIPCRHLAGRAA